MSVADEVQKLVALRDSGALTSEEFEDQKRRTLGSAPAAVDQVEAKPPVSGSGMVFMTALVVFAIAVTAYWVQNPSANDVRRSEAETSIQACWYEHERKSLTPSQKRVVADSCEKQEDEYRRRYGMNP